MKNLLSIIALCSALVFSAQVQAQDTRSRMDRNKKTQDVQDQQPSVTAMALSQTARMANDLNLTVDQREKLLEENRELYTKMTSMNTKDLDNEEVRESKTEAFKNYDKALEDILDEKQYDKYVSNKTKYMKRVRSESMEHAPHKDRMHK